MSNTPIPKFDKVKRLPGQVFITLLYGVIFLFIFSDYSLEKLDPLLKYVENSAELELPELILLLLGVVFVAGLAGRFAWFVFVEFIKDIKNGTAKLIRWIGYNYNKGAEDAHKEEEKQK